MISAARIIARFLLSAMVGCVIFINSTFAQPAAPAALPTRVSMPDDAKITLLIQMHMAALSHANLTGNYSVLQALGSPAFQGANSVNQLAANFTIFRTQGIDISPTQLLPPLLFGPPKLEGLDLLRVSGQYDTKPQRVVFEMAFQAVNNAWRLAGIAVRTVDAKQLQSGSQGGDQPNSVGQAAKAARPNGPTKK